MQEEPKEPDSVELDELVVRTSGAQPWRRLFHAATGVTVAATLTYVLVDRWTAVALLGAVLVIVALTDLVRMINPQANRLFFRVFVRLASPREARGVASSTWYVAGILLAVAAFPMHAAVSGVLVLALADPVASYIGRRWGRRAFLGGTVLGTATFFLVALGILAARHTMLPALATAAVATIAERRSWPLDDNLTVPVVCAGALTVLGLVM